MRLALARIILPVGLALFTNACATSLGSSAVPAPLELARVSFTASSSGPAAVFAAGYLADARRSLEKADAEYAANGDTGVCRDYAYIAQNKVELAESIARSAQDDLGAEASTGMAPADSARVLAAPLTLAAAR